MDVVSWLADHPLFVDFDAETLQRLCDEGDVRPFEVGETLIAAGQPGRHVGVVLEGRLEVVTTDAGGRPTTLADLTEGEYFGEISLISGEPTTADVRAAIPSTVLLVPHAAFSAALAAHPQALQHLARTVSQRLRAQLANQNGSTLAGAPAVEAYQAGDAGSAATVLVLKCEGDTLRYSYFDVEREVRNLEGRVEGVGTDGARLHQTSLRGQVDARVGPSVVDAVETVIHSLAGDNGPLDSLDELTLVVHRLAHGGERFGEPVLVAEAPLDATPDACCACTGAPYCVDGLNRARELAPGAEHVAIFDTAFFQRMPAEAFLYAAPYELYRDSGVRRYGSHGLTHHQALLLAADHLDSAPEQLRVVVCRLDDATSVAAISQGRPVECSVGLGEGGGVPSATEPGDVDPAFVFRVARENGLTLDGTEALLRGRYGLGSLAGVDGGLREIAEAAAGGNTRAQLALDVWEHAVRKSIGAHAAVLGGLDALVITGPLADVTELRSRACGRLVHLGVDVEAAANRSTEVLAAGVSELSGPWSRVRVLLTPTDEQRMAAGEGLAAIGRAGLAGIFRTRRRPIPISISAHHVHLAQEHVEALFGDGHQLTFRAWLSQPGQFACEEAVTLVGPRGAVERVRVLGPTRSSTQVEISRTEEFKLGIDAPVRASGDVEGSPGLTLRGSEGEVELPHGVICAARHVHMSPEDALRFGVRDRDMIAVVVEGDRSVAFRDVLVRVHPDFRLDMHVDTDEGNAAELDRDAVGYMESVDR